MYVQTACCSRFLASCKITSTCDVGKNCFWQGSNLRPSACEADVITTTLQKRLHVSLVIFSMTRPISWSCSAPSLFGYYWAISRESGGPHVTPAWTAPRRRCWRQRTATWRLTTCTKLNTRPARCLGGCVNQWINKIIDGLLDYQCWLTVRDIVW